MFGKRKQFLGVFFVVGTLLFMGISSSAQALLKDSDVDGLTDQAEVSVYKTDPTNNDTDKDGFDDGYEVDQKTSPIDALSLPLTAVGDTVSAGFLDVMATFFIRLGLPMWAIWFIAVVVSVAIGCVSVLVGIAIQKPKIAPPTPRPTPTPSPFMDEKI